MVRDVLFLIAIEAILTPSKEPRPFGAAHANLRLDLLYPHFWSGKDACIDIAVIMPLIESHLAAAAEAPGAAATAYEGIKRRHYRDAIQQDRHVLVPLIMDCFGGMGEAANTLLRSLAFFWGMQHNMGPSTAVPRIFGRVSLALAQGVARTLLAARPDDESEWPVGDE